MTRLTRRHFLHFVASLTTFAAMRPIRQFFHATSDPVALALAGLFAHKASARIVGQEYLDAAPNEADPQLLVDLIFPASIVPRAELIKKNVEEICTLVSCRQRQDFENNHTVKIHGWIMSKTEARLCALVALI